tara:strand:+ start:343 stop:486 length:144 start_codon:yes stop_codon:yes gene_type:complete
VTVRLGVFENLFKNGFTSFLLVLVWNIKGALSGSLVGVCPAYNRLVE